jgi:hypothetical protein
MLIGRIRPTYSLPAGNILQWKFYGGVYTLMMCMRVKFQIPLMTTIKSHKAFSNRDLSLVFGSPDCGPDHNYPGIG